MVLAAGLLMLSVPATPVDGEGSEVFMRIEGEARTNDPGLCPEVSEGNEITVVEDPVFSGGAALKVAAVRTKCHVEWEVHVPGAVSRAFLVARLGTQTCMIWALWLELISTGDQYPCWTERLLRAQTTFVGLLEPGDRTIRLSLHHAQGGPTPGVLEVDYIELMLEGTPC